MRPSSIYIKSIIHIESNCFEVYIFKEERSMRRPNLASDSSSSNIGKMVQDGTRLSDLFRLEQPSSIYISKVLSMHRATAFNYIIKEEWSMRWPNLACDCFSNIRGNGPGWNSTLWLISSQPWHMHMRSSSIYISKVLSMYRATVLKYIIKEERSMRRPNFSMWFFFFQYWGNGPGWNSTL
jgi:hypothetical protein